MQKTIIYSSEARQKLLAGAKKVSQAVGVTMGPSGKCVLIARGFVADYGMQHLPVHVSKDGYTVARSIKLIDPLENVGAQIIQEAAERTVMQAGDGTTCCCILAEAIMRMGMGMVEKGANSQELKRGIEKGVQYVIEQLKEMAIPIGEGVEEIRKIAYVSANSDDEIADIIAEAFSEIGKEGVINIEEAKGTKTVLTITDGFQFEKGWESSSHQFINNPAKLECELEKPLIFLYDRPLNQMNPLIPILTQVKNAGRSLLIVAEEITGEALAFLGVNNQNGNLKVCAVKAPIFGENKSEVMEDMAAATGATFVSDLKGIGLENVTLEHLGEAKRVVVTRTSTTIIEGQKNKERLEDLVNNLRMNITQAKSDGEKEQIESRIARLLGSVAIIAVGGTTETEMKERKDRCDDAVRATKSAIAEGYVAGGGISFLRVSSKPGTAHPDFIRGVNIVFEALKEPFKQICKNADLDPDKMLSEVELLEGANGYNAKTNKTENLLESGVIDPVKVLRCALENAASVAAMALITETIICDTI